MGVALAEVLYETEAAPLTGNAPVLRDKAFAHDDTSKVPVKSFRDDISRKKKLKKVMGPPEKDQPEPASEAVPIGFDDDGPLGIDDGDDHAQPDGDREDPLASIGMGDDDDDTSATAQGDQLTKEEVNYRYSGAKTQSCGACVHFIYPGACEIVAGLIRAVDVCDKFKAKNGGAGAPAFGWQNPQDDDESEHGEPQPEFAGGLKRLRQARVVQAEIVTSNGGPSYGMVAGEKPASSWGMVTKMKTKTRASEADALIKNLQHWAADAGGSFDGLTHDKDTGKAFGKFTDSKTKKTVLIDTRDVTADAVRTNLADVRNGKSPRGNEKKLALTVTGMAEGGPGSGPQGGGAGKKYPLGPGTGTRPAVKSTARGMNASEDAKDIADTVTGEVTPPGFEPVVRALKKKPGIKSPYAVAWSMKNRGIKPKKASEAMIQRIGMRIARAMEGGGVHRAPFPSLRLK